jgi:hypothetical protein
MVLVFVPGRGDARFDAVLGVHCSLLLLGFTFVIKESHTPFSKTNSHQNKNAFQQTFFAPFISMQTYYPSPLLDSPLLFPT